VLSWPVRVGREDEPRPANGSAGEPPSFGMLLRRYRLAAGLTQAALAERAGLSVRGIADLERGARRYPYADTVERLAEALGLGAAERATLTTSRRRSGGRGNQAGSPTHAARVRPEAAASAVPTRRHNLPAHLPSLIGREEAVARVRERLLRAESGLLTLTGAGGSGKTRLALAVAADLLDAFPDGVWLVELAALGDAGLVPGAVAAGIGIPEQPGRAARATLLEALASRSLLLVLDNCEHLVEACAALADELLRACPGLRILATSREPLRVAAEQTWRVPTLPVPDPHHPPRVEELPRYAAVRLFVERARAVQSDFQLTEHNGPAVAGVCARLGGLPLAIELAAARVRMLGPEQILERLDDAFALLVGGSRTAPTRQQTLRATIDWSYALLDQRERQLFERVSVFAGGWELEAAEAVAADGGVQAAAVLDLLGHLVDRSMVLVDADASGAAVRYRLLDTLRQYGRERLEARGEAGAVRARHADAFVRLAERAEQELHGPGQRRWLDRLEAEQGNLREALAWAVEREEVVPGLRLGAALWRFWSIRGHLAEGRRWLEALLALAERGAAPVVLLARALRGVGHLAFARGSVEAAAACFDASRALCLEADDQVGVAAALRDLGSIEQARGDYARATTLYEQSLGLYRRLGDTAGVATCLDDLGEVARHRSEYERAAALDEEALALQRELGDAAGMAFSLNELANVARHRGEYARGRAFATEALALQRELGDLRGAATSLNNLGIMAQACGEHEEADRLYQEALSLFRETGDKHGISVVLPGLSASAYVRGDVEQARRLAEQALRLHRDLGEERAIAQRLDALGRLARLTGDGERARGLHRESLALFARLGDRRGMAMALDGFAALAALHGEPIRAIELFGVASALREAIGAAPDFGAYVDPAATEAVLAELRACLGEDAFARAWAGGRRQPLEQAVAAVLAGEGRWPSARAGTPPRRLPGDPLTSREREVVRLVARGSTNREIAAALLISPGTARTHVEHVLAKLGVRSRVEIAAWASARGLA
jgi:predicted ATPase/DNA-binding CsgD family transcriptional regulator/transcriptional regulator with XRE-family HTH domain